VRVVSEALQQFEALKPLYVELRTANHELRQTTGQLRVALAYADTARAATGRALAAEEARARRAEQERGRCARKARGRGWIIVGETALIIVLALL
jgi:septal ring factor EnvC (AmiA/AmiB activator)